MGLFDWFKRDETKSIRLTDPAAAEIFGVYPIASSVAVAGEAALRSPAVLACVRAISEGVGQLPVRVEGSGAAAVVRRWGEVGPNEFTSWQTFVTAMVRDALIYGRGLAMITRAPNGRPLECFHLPVGSVTREQRSAVEAPVYRVHLADGGSQVLSRRDIIEIDPLGGRSVVSLAAEAIGISLAAERHAAGLMGNGARPAGVVERDAATGAMVGTRGKGPEGEKEQADKFRERYEGASNSGKTLVLPPGFKFKPLQFSSVDSQFVQLREFQIDEIARAFRVPPTVIQHLAKATQSNVENLSLEFVKFGLLSWIRLWEGELRRVAGVPVTLDLNDLLRADMESRADAYAKMASAGLSLNEIRAMEGRPPKDGGDDLLRPMNMMRATSPDTIDSERAAPGVGNAPAPSSDGAVG